jgi:hypothetical protein
MKTGILEATGEAGCKWSFFKVPFLQDYQTWIYTINLPVLSTMGLNWEVNHWVSWFFWLWDLD